MPLLVKCQKCGAVLYEGEDLKTPDEIVGPYNGKCPNCGKKLSNIPKIVEIKSISKTHVRALKTHHSISNKFIACMQ